MTSLGRRLERTLPLHPWVALTSVGVATVVVAVLHYFNEVAGIGFGIGPVVAAAMGVALGAGVAYAGVRLRGSDLEPDEGWLVVAVSVGGGCFTAAAYGLTVVVRYVEGRPLVEPLFPLLVTAAVGALGGVVIGSEYVATRRLTREARESRDAMAFTNNLLRHDVRNALQIVDGYASVLRDHDDESVRESAETIGGQTDSLERVVTEVESVVDVLNDDLAGDVVDVSTVLGEAVDAVGADQSGVTVDADVSGEFPVEGGDALYPVFSNLLGNAAEHANEDGVRVEVTASRRDGDLVVGVADDGPGIPDEVREQVFQRGVSTDGGGYGLYVAQTVVDRLGGEISVTESDLGGAEFVVEVPLTQPPGEESDPFA